MSGTDTRVETYLAHLLNVSSILKGTRLSRMEAGEHGGWLVDTACFSVYLLRTELQSTQADNSTKPKARTKH